MNRARLAGAVEEVVWTTNSSHWSGSWPSFCAAPEPAPERWRGKSIRSWNPLLTGCSYGWRRPRCQRATELSGYFGVGKATMSRQLRALEDLGLVTRERDPADGRASLVRLTEEGLARFQRVRDARRDLYVQKLADWDRGEVLELSRLLGHLNASAEQL